MVTAQKPASSYDDFSLLEFFSLGTNTEEVGSWIHPAWALPGLGFDRQVLQNETS